MTAKPRTTARCAAVVPEAQDREAPPATEPQSYQTLLDAALEETFPASDPIAASAAEHGQRRLRTPGNAVDWTLEPTAPTRPKDPP